MDEITIGERPTVSYGHEWRGYADGVWRCKVCGAEGGNRTAPRCLRPCHERAVGTRVDDDEPKENDQCAT